MNAPDANRFNRVVVSLGSNLDAEKNLRAALDLLQENFGKLRLSPVYQNHGYAKEDNSVYLNGVVIFNTQFAQTECLAKLKKIEDCLGRVRKPDEKNTPVSCDLDLLLFGNTSAHRAAAKPHKDILEQDFVLRPLSDLLGEETHPVTGKSYAQCWQEWPKTNGANHTLKTVDLSSQSVLQQ